MVYRIVLPTLVCLSPFITIHHHSSYLYSPCICIHIHSYPFISIHIHLHPFISIHFRLHPFISIHIHSCPLISIHIHLHPFISIHFRLHPFISIYIHSCPFISINHESLVIINIITYNHSWHDKPQWIELAPKPFFARRNSPGLLAWRRWGQLLGTKTHVEKNTWKTHDFPQKWYHIGAGRDFFWKPKNDGCCCLGFRGRLYNLTAIVPQALIMFGNLIRQTPEIVVVSFFCTWKELFCDLANLFWIRTNNSLQTYLPIAQGTATYLNS